MSEQNFVHFGYGSNMCIGKLAKVAPSASMVCTGWLDGYRLACHKISTDGSGKFDCVYTGIESDRVWGVLFNIANAEREALDKSEPRYVQKVISVLTLGGVVDAVIYIAQLDAKDTALKPYHWYKQHALDGALAAGLPEGYVNASIRSLESIFDADSARVAREEAKRAIS